MTKINVTRYIDIENWTLNQIINHVKSLKLKFEDVNIVNYTQYGYDSDRETPCLEYKELETDQEYLRRMDQNNKRLKSVANHERSEYERLKKKFGNT